MQLLYNSKQENTNKNGQLLTIKLKQLNNNYGPKKTNKRLK